MLAINISGNIRPFVGQVDDSAGSLDLFQHLQGCPQHRYLSGCLAGLAQGVQPREYSMAAIRGTQTDSVTFDFTLYQSNGPAANRSGRDKDNDIGLVSAQIADDSRDSFLEQLFRLQNVAHD